jgi:SM-20-related protein
VTLAAELEERSWGVVPRFVDDRTCAALAAEIGALGAAGDLSPAGVGRGATWQVRPDVRADRVHWVDWQDQETLSAAQRHVRGAFEDLRVTLNRRLLLGLRGFEGHVTAYPPGAGYARHVDNFRGTGGRIVSCVLYLNPNWLPEEGGQLRLYDSAGAVSADILPEAGTLACFLSAAIVHEVLPATRERLSVTGWFLGR